MSKTGNLQLFFLVLKQTEAYNSEQTPYNLYTTLWTGNTILSTDVCEVFDCEVELVLAEQFP